MNSHMDRQAEVLPFTSRLYENDQDLKSLLDFLMQARARANDWRYPHIGDLVWRLFMIICRADPRENVRLWHDRNGQMVAYALVGGDDVSMDWQVLPEYEWHGIEEEAMAWAEATLAELVRRDPKTWSGDLLARSTQDNARRTAFLERHRFALGAYSEINMIRSLEGPIPSSALPAGSMVRAVASAEDNAKRADAYRATWHPYEVANVTDGQFAQFMTLAGYERELDLVTFAPDGVSASQVIGWLDPVNKIGDLGPVGARPGYRQKGYTRAALLEALRRMQARGLNRACISTGTGNVAAQNLYESIGFKVVNKTLEFAKR